MVDCNVVQTSYMSMVQYLTYYAKCLHILCQEEVSAPNADLVETLRMNFGSSSEQDTYAVTHESTLTQQKHSHGPVSSCSPLSVSSICDSHVTLPTGND